MKKIMVILLLISWFSGLSIAQGNNEILVPFSSPEKKGKLRVNIRKGSIKVKGTGRKDILVKYSPRKSAKDDQKTKNGLTRVSSSAIDLEISEKNNLIDVESGSWNRAVDLEIEVPSTIDLHVETYNSGDIFISQITGEIVADNYNGKIDAEDISGSLVATTYNGHIKVSFVKVTPDTPMAFTTYNGDVDLALPASFKANMKMKTARGEIYSGFDFKTVQADPVTKTSKKSGTYKVYLDDWVRGKINGGGPEMLLKNYNGDIYLRVK